MAIEVETIQSQQLARIGVLALVIGVAFFLKFVFNNDWIGPTGRVILGITAGLGMLGLGHYWHKLSVLCRSISSGQRGLGSFLLDLTMKIAGVHTGKRPISRY
jgi:hypothetical protein